MKAEKITPKLVVETQAAYLCNNCGNQIIVMANLPTAPTQCGNCDGTSIQKLWAQKITTHTTVEHL